MRTAIDQEKYRSPVRSTSAARWWNGGMQLLTGIGDTFLPAGLVDPYAHNRVDERTWREHYRRSINRLHDEGITTTQDLVSGEDKYVMLSREWQPHISALTDYLLYEWHEICPIEQGGGPKRCELA